MITHGGERVYVDDNGVPSLHTIGWSLSRIARFNGHTEHYYPVLAHVLVVASLLPAKAAVYGLIHDAPEICCSDVPTPWKTKAAKKREARLMKRLCKSLDLPYPFPEDVEAMVAHADMQALIAEYQVLGGAVPTMGVAQPRWEAPLFAKPSPRAVKATEEMLALCKGMPFPAAKGAEMFANSYDLYRGRYDKRRKRSNSDGQRRADSSPDEQSERRANRARAGVDRAAS